MPPKRKRKRPVSPTQSAAGASGGGQQDQEQGQVVKEVIVTLRSRHVLDVEVYIYHATPCLLLTVVSRTNPMLHVAGHAACSRA
ncbi:hypothetical protein HaLaN_15640, partial [Haematococcus lacustris]